MKNLREKTITASEKFLERRGCEIIDTDWEASDGFGSIDIVTEDENAIVFIDVKVARGSNGFPDEDKSRDERGILAAKWLVENSDRADMTIRFDAIVMMVVSEGRALLRHRINQTASEEEWRPPLLLGGGRAPRGVPSGLRCRASEPALMELYRAPFLQSYVSVRLPGRGRLRC